MALHTETTTTGTKTRTPRVSKTSRTREMLAQPTASRDAEIGRLKDAAQDEYSAWSSLVARSHAKLAEMLGTVYALGATLYDVTDNEYKVYMAAIGGRANRDWMYTDILYWLWPMPAGDKREINRRKTRVSEWANALAVARGRGWTAEEFASKYTTLADLRAAGQEERKASGTFRPRPKASTASKAKVSNHGHGVSRVAPEHVEPVEAHGPELMDLAARVGNPAPHATDVADLWARFGSAPRLGIMDGIDWPDGQDWGVALVRRGGDNLGHIVSVLSDQDLAGSLAWGDPPLSDDQRERLRNRKVGSFTTPDERAARMAELEGAR